MGGQANTHHHSLIEEDASKKLRSLSQSQISWAQRAGYLAKKPPIE
jgi:hypothetical protein